MTRFPLSSPANASGAHPAIAATTGCPAFAEHDKLGGMSIRERASAARAGISPPRPRHARARCAAAGGARARARSRGPRRAGRSSARRDEAAAIATLAARRLAREPVARILGRKEFWGLPLAAQRRDPGAAAGDRDRGRGGARRARPRPPAVTRPAGRRPRHRLGRAPARARLRAAGSLRGRHRCQHCRRSACARDNAAALGLAGRAAFVACDYGTALAGRSICSSPIRPMWRAARSQRWRPRCATSIRAARSTAGRTGSTAIARSRPMRGGCLHQAARWWWSWAPAGRRGGCAPERRRAGPRPAPPRHDLAGVARALVARRLP